MRLFVWLASPILIVAICGWYYQNAQADRSRDVELPAGESKSQELLLEHKKTNIERRYARIRDGMSLEAVSKRFRFCKVTELSSEGSLKTIAWTDGPYGVVVTFRNGKVIAKARQ